jgi:glycosyltransferase involved in cell wall biosynthesis
MNQPLVSIMIPNFNHSRFLDTCIQSALDQTYLNKEIVVVDNASTDASVAIARKYSNQGVRVCRNSYNILNSSYKELANIALTSGSFMILLCADDYISETFVEKAVAIMEKYPNVGYVHGERNFITESGNILELDPFFKCSFVAPGINTMPIYMVTTIAHPAQAIFRREVFNRIGGYGMPIDHMNADRALWFYMSAVSDYAYIREKMSYIRIGEQTETMITMANFQHPIFCHLTVKEFVRFAKQNNLPDVYGREQEALGVLAKEFLGYAAGMLWDGDFEKAKVYLNYSKIVNREIVNAELYKVLYQMYLTQNIDKSFIKTLNPNNHKKKRSYEPPKGYHEIETEPLKCQR